MILGYKPDFYKREVGKLTNKDNSGSLFRNDRRENEKQPTHTGTAIIGGVRYRISAWVRTAGERAKNPGTRFFSLAFQPADDQWPDQPGGNQPKKQRDIPI